MNIYGMQPLYQVLCDVFYVDYLHASKTFSTTTLWNMYHYSHTTDRQGKWNMGIVINLPKMAQLVNNKGKTPVPKLIILHYAENLSYLPE